MSHDEYYYPLAPYSDGERLAVPLWHELDDKRTPSWFFLDTAISRSIVSETLARQLGATVEAGGTAVVRGLYFAGEPVKDMQVRVAPDDSPVFGYDEARADGLLGLDFLHDWDVDLDVSQGVCRAWPAGPELAPYFALSFGLQDALEVPLVGGRGLLELSACLRGTVCSGSDRTGPPIRALVDLGQTFSACNWVAARQVGVTSANSPCVRSAGQWLGLQGSELEVSEAEMGVAIPGRASGVLRGVRLCEQRRFWIADSLPVLERLGYSPAEPLASLGLDTVGRSRLGISARHQRLWIPK